MKKMKEGIDAIKETQKFLNKIKGPCPTCGRIHVDLPIKRVPKKTLELFKRLAQEENCGDYGFTLKFLLDFYFGRVVDGSAIAEAKADEALAQCAEIISKEAKPEEKVIKMLDGTERRIK